MVADVSPREGDNDQSMYDIVRVYVELISFNFNIFRVYFNYQQVPGPKEYGPVTQQNLDAIRKSEIADGAPENPFRITDAELTFNTANLVVSFAEEFVCTVKDQEGTLICQDARDSNGNNLGGTFVDPKVWVGFGKLRRRSTPYLIDNMVSVKST